MGGVFNPFNLDAYQFTHNNPVRYVDPDGKISVGFSGSLQINIFGFRRSVGIELRYYRNENPKDGTKNAITLSRTVSKGSLVDFATKSDAEQNWSPDNYWAEFSNGLEADAGTNILVSNADEPEQLAGPSRVSGAAGGGACGIAIDVAQPVEDESFPMKVIQNDQGVDISEESVAITPMPGSTLGLEVHIENDANTNHWWAKEW